MFVTGRSLHNNDTGCLELELPFELVLGIERRGSGYADEFLQLPGLGAWLGAKGIVDRCFTCWVDLAQLIFLGSDLELVEGHSYLLGEYKNIDLMSLCVGQVLGIFGSLFQGSLIPKQETLLPTKQVLFHCLIYSSWVGKEFYPIS